jgi:hypothetical protein
MYYYGMGIVISLTLRIGDMTNNFKAKSFPIDQTATYAEIAKAVHLDEVNVRRFVRHAMTNRIFKEVSPGVVAHTAASRVLAEDRPMQDWVGFCVEDMWPVRFPFPEPSILPTNSLMD